MAQLKVTATTIKYFLNEAILNENADEVLRYLKVLPIAKLSVPKSNDYLLTLLRLANSVKSYRITRVLISYWDSINPIAERNPILITLLMLTPGTNDILPMVIEAFRKDKSPYMYFINFIDQEPSIELQLGITYLDNYFGSQNKAFYEGLLDYAEKESKMGRFNPTLINWLKSRIRILSNYHDIPTWVKNFRDDGILPMEEDLDLPPFEEVKFNLPDTHKAVEIMTKGILPGKELKRIQQFIASSYKTSTAEEKQKMLEPFMQADASLDMFADKKVFRILGPVNPMVGLSTDLTSNKPCSNYGGCRMFTCCEFENYSDDNGPINEDSYEGIEWFTGYCANKDCKTPKIREYWHAIRMPMTHGGYYGCYCSFECMRGNKAVDDMVIDFLINQMEKRINEIGIQDRQLPHEDEEVDDTILGQEESNENDQYA